MVEKCRRGSELLGGCYKEKRDGKLMEKEPKAQGRERKYTIAANLSMEGGLENLEIGKDISLRKCES